MPTRITLIDCDNDPGRMAVAMQQALTEYNTKRRQDELNSYGTDPLRIGFKIRSFTSSTLIKIGAAIADAGWRLG